MENEVFLILATIILLMFTFCVVCFFYLIGEFILKVYIAIKMTIDEKKEYERQREIIKYNFKRRMEQLRAEAEEAEQ